MMDLETFGVNQQAAIVQLGACVFAFDGPIPEGNYSPEFRESVSLQSALLAGLKIDDSTVDWWKDQNSEAQFSICIHCVPLEAALKNFVTWFQRIESEVKGEVEGYEIWSRGTDFDVALLKNAFAAVGVKYPLKYNAGRDVRTIVALANELGWNPGRKFEAEVEHDALEDCKAQAKQVSTAFRFMRIAHEDADNWRNRYLRDPNCKMPGQEILGVGGDGKTPQMMTPGGGEKG